MELSKNLLDTLRYKKTYLFLAVFHETCWKNSAHTLPSLEKKIFSGYSTTCMGLRKNQSNPALTEFFFLSIVLLWCMELGKN